MREQFDDEADLIKGLLEGNSAAFETFQRTALMGSNS